VQFTTAVTTDSDQRQGLFIIVEKIFEDHGQQAVDQVGATQYHRFHRATAVVVLFQAIVDGLHGLLQFSQAVSMARRGARCEVTGESIEVHQAVDHIVFFGSCRCRQVHICLC